MELSFKMFLSWIKVNMNLNCHTKFWSPSEKFYQNNSDEQIQQNACWVLQLQSWVSNEGCRSHSWCFWIDFDEFLQDERNKELTNLKEAFDVIGNEMVLDAEQESVLIKFADKFITCTWKDPGTRDIVQEVNIHHHTRSCQKPNCAICRFLFPGSQQMKLLFLSRQKSNEMKQNETKCY